MKPSLTITTRPTNTLKSDSQSNVSYQRLLQYVGDRFGQRSETHKRYDEAVKACSSIDYLDKTISDIARLFDLTPESLRNQLKRHFPEVIANRDKLRQQLGLTKQPVRGLKPSTEAKYAPAIAMLRDTELTIKEVAEKCKVSFYGLQQHLLFYHKDVAESRLLQRTKALARTPQRGERNAANRMVRPKPEAEALYATAVELYRTTDRSLTDIAIDQGLDPHNFACYIQRWHRDEMLLRQKLRSEQAEERRKERDRRKENSRSAVAERRYAQAFPLIERGATYEEAARQLGITAYRLSWWMRHHRPDIHERARQNAWVTLPNGSRIMRQKWEKFQVAERAFCTTEEPVSHIAKRLGVGLTSLKVYLNSVHPEVAERRRAKRIKADKK